MNTQHQSQTATTVATIEPANSTSSSSSNSSSSISSSASSSSTTSSTASLFSTAGKFTLERGLGSYDDARVIVKQDLCSDGLLQNVNPIGPYNSSASNVDDVFSSIDLKVAEQGYQLNYAQNRAPFTSYIEHVCGFTSQFTIFSIPFFYTQIRLQIIYKLFLFHFFLLTNFSYWYIQSPVVVTNTEEIDGF